MDNPLSKLALDYWYQVLMVVSVVVFLSVGAGLLHAFPTVPTAIISLGGFFVGLGELINHPLQTALVPPSTYHPPGVITGHPRNSSLLGVGFLVLGLVLVGIGVFKLLA